MVACSIPLVSTNSNGIHEPVGDTVSNLVGDIVDKIEDKELNGRTTAKENEGLFTNTYFMYVSCLFTFLINFVFIYFFQILMKMMMISEMNYP